MNPEITFVCVFADGRTVEATTPAAIPPQVGDVITIPGEQTADNEPMAFIVAGRLLQTGNAALGQTFALVISLESAPQGWDLPPVRQ